MIKYSEMDYIASGSNTVNVALEKNANEDSESVIFFKNMEKEKDTAYILIIAMGAGEYYNENKNGDFFREKDLIEYHKNFKNAGVFRGHDNKDINKSMGKVVESFYNNKMHRIELVIAIKKEKAPDIYNNIQAGFRTGWSMGVRVPTEFCSYCGHVTKGGLQNRCDHLKYEMHVTKENGVKVYAINGTPMDFFDISYVQRPADKQGWELFSKAASEHPTKYAEFMNGIRSTGEINSYKDMLSKKASIVKYFDSLGQKMQHFPPKEMDAIKKNNDIGRIMVVVKRHKIPLLPSEGAYLAGNYKEKDYPSLCALNRIDNFMDLLKKMLSNGGSGSSRAVNIEKYAELDDIPELVNLGNRRKALLKVASSKNLQYSKRVNHNNFKNVKINYTDGSSAVVGASMLKESVLPIMAEDGLIESIVGLTGTGKEKELYFNSSPLDHIKRYQEDKPFSIFGF